MCSEWRFGVMSCLKGNCPDGDIGCENGKSDRTYDTRFMIERYVDLDERWLFDLAKDPEGRKPTVTWQTYNRGGVLYGSYDEMLISLLPRKVENPELRRALRDYFRIRSEKVSVEESITVYKDAAERFGDE